MGAQQPQRGPYQQYGAGTSALGPQNGTGADMEAQAFEQSSRSGGAAEGSWNPMVSAQAFEQSARAGGAAGGNAGTPWWAAAGVHSKQHRPA